MIETSIAEELANFFRQAYELFGSDLSFAVEAALAGSIVYFTRQQASFAKESVRQNLLKERFDVLHPVLDLRRVSRKRRLETEDIKTMTDQYKIQIRARYVFGSEVVEWLDHVSSSVDRYFWILEDLRDHEEIELSLEELRANAKKARLDMEELFEQRETIFAPYLDFSMYRQNKV